MMRELLDVLFPRKCIACGRVLSADEENLCAACLEDLPETYYWQRKFNPLADKFNSLIQKWLEAAWSSEEDYSAREPYAYGAALFFYRSSSGYSAITRQLKYNGKEDVGVHFGRMLGQRLSSAEWFSDVDTVIAVPLHWRRRWSRGYNQSEIIAGALADELGCRMRKDILKRRRATKTQTRVKVEQKLRNVEGAFRIKKGYRREESIRHILLVDDVFTTGSTLYSCFTALRTVFPSSVRISVATLGFVSAV